MNPLLDIDFINELSKNNEREVFAKITSLNKQEHPIEAIEGKVSDGSINIDGNSLIRRTCNLTLVAEDVNINEFYWGLRNKFTLELGLKNEINENYPEIIWFKMGTYVITQFNTTLAANKWTIKISGKDKMCLLNGEVSGNLFAETDFSTEEYHDLENDTVIYTEIPIKTIIQNVVNVFGGELLQNIIINDLDDSGLVLLEYLNNDPAYLYKEYETNEYKNIILDGNIECYYPFKTILTRDEYLSIPQEYIYLSELYDVVVDKETQEVTYVYNNNTTDEFNKHIYRDDTYQQWFLGKLKDDYIITYDILQPDLELAPQATIIKFPKIEIDKENNITKIPSKENYVLAKIETGEVPGYFYTDLTYANGDKKLIGKAGEALTSILNKIKEMLVHFEYFYDVNGKFVFQKKADYISVPWNSLDTTDMELYSNSRLDNANIMFSFLDSKMVTSFQNTPKLTNVKNDFTTWGSYKINDVEIPIHMRYAIDVKPEQYLPIRPLMERVEIVLRKNDEIISENIKYNYYNEPFPHKKGSLIDLILSEEEEGYIDRIVKILNNFPEIKRVFGTITNLSLKESYIEYKDENKFEKWNLISSTLEEWLEKNMNSTNVALLEDFQKAIMESWHYKGSFENTQYSKNLRKLKKGEEYNGFKVSEITVVLENGYKQTTTIIPYFAKKPFYSKPVEEIYDYQSRVSNPYHVPGSDVPGESEFLYLTKYQNDFKEQSIYSDFNSFLKNTLETSIYESFLIKYKYNPVDWRELIYQMALDYSKCHTFDDFYYYLAQANPDFPSGITGYEQYYIDLQSFWRDLYNPNPNINYEPIAFNEVKKSSLLLDDDEINDIYDNIYVENGYERITKNNILNLSLTPYNLCNMVKTNDRIKGPYPFITGDKCHLNLQVPYYINVEGTLKEYQSLKENDIAYDKLNETALSNIYMKDSQRFTTLIQAKGENKTYQPFNTFDKEIEPDKRYKQFMVLRYPATSNFERHEQEFFKVIDVNFTNLTSVDKWYDQDEYYYKSQGSYQKLKDIFDLDEAFKDVYYGPSINLVKSHADILQKQLNSMKLSEYPKNNKIKILSDHCNAIQEFLSVISKYNFIDLDNGLNKEIDEILNSHKLYFEGTINGFIDNNYEFLQPDYSCLNSKLKNLLSQMEKTIASYSLLKEKGYTNKIIVIKKLYEHFAGLVKEIPQLFEEVKSIKDLIPDIKKAGETLENIDTVLQTYLDNFNKKVSSAYDDGQVPLTLRNIRLIKNNLKDATEEDIYDIMQQIDFCIEKPVTLMETFLDNVYAEEGNIYYLLTINHKDFTSFIQTLINSSTSIDTLLREYETNFSKEQKKALTDMICFERQNGLLTPILNNLYNLLIRDAENSEFEKYYIDTSNFQEFILLNKLNNFNVLSGDLTQEKINYYVGSHNYRTDYTIGDFWNKSVYDKPELLTFWFDFLDANQNELSRISVPAIGQRTKVITDKNVKAIAYTEIPQVIFKKPNDNYEIKSGYTYVNINNNTEGFFRTSARSKSAKERIDELLYNHSYCTDNITISVIPVYHLEPNHHIYVRDDESNIDGEYIVNKITIPLSFKKTMNITATKAAQYLN